ncbi:hypothetical protein WA158_003897 [Blastocystis sp. Blastoise]
MDAQPLLSTEKNSIVSGNLQNVDTKQNNENKESDINSKSIPKEFIDVNSSYATVWSSLLNHSKNELVRQIDLLFPYQTKEISKKSLTTRDIRFHFTLNNAMIETLNTYTSFPSDTYNWPFLNNHPSDTSSVMLGTYYVQNMIWKSQNPEKCDKKYVLVPIYPATFEANIHILTSLLSLAIDEDRVLVFMPIPKESTDNIKLCSLNSLECFLEPLSHCSVDSTIINQYYKDPESVKQQVFDIYSLADTQVNNVRNYPYWIIHINTPFVENLKSMVPVFITNLLADQNFSENELADYWRTQAVAFITRFKKSYVEKMNVFKESHCKSCQPQYDVSLILDIPETIEESSSIYIEQNGQLKPSDYIPSFDILRNYYEHNSIHVYVQARSHCYLPQFIDMSIYNLCIPDELENKFTASYKEQYNLLTQEEELLYHYQFSYSIHHLFGLRESLLAKDIIGSYSNEYARLVHQLKQVVGYGANDLFIEIGQVGCVSYSQCSLSKRTFELL